MSRSRHFNDRLETGFKAHGGRISGTGIEEDSYDEESFPDDRPFNIPLVTIRQKPIEVPVYPVKKYKLSKKELDYYKNLDEAKKSERKERSK